MANLGFLNDVISISDIWYCLTCRRCNQVCPNLVRPADLISFLRYEAIRRKLFSWKWFSEYRDFFYRFQRVRWHAAEKCRHDEISSLSSELWRQWLDSPIEPLKGEITFEKDSSSDGFKDAAEMSRTTSCFNCSECSNVCPLFFDRSVFDPQWIFRMVNMGLEKEILASPSIWLCIGCERCTEACGEEVKGHLIIQSLQKLAVEEGIVDKGFPFRWKQAQEVINTLFVEEVDSLWGAHSV
jgi:heterodisulfide reductase subunit C